MFNLTISRDTGQSVKVVQRHGQYIMHRNGFILSAIDYGRELAYWLSVAARRGL